MTQDQIQETARKQAQTVKNGATFLTIAGTVLVAIACYGITFTNNINYMIVLIVGFLIAMFGFVSSKQ
jgi:hypothetical protein